MRYNKIRERLFQGLWFASIFASGIGANVYASEASIQNVLSSGQLDTQFAGAGRELLSMPHGVEAIIVDADMRSQTNRASSLVQVVDRNSDSAPAYWMYVHTGDGNPLPTVGGIGRFPIQILDKAYAFLDTGSHYLVVGQAGGRPAVAAYAADGQPLTEVGDQGLFVVGSFPNGPGQYLEGAFTSIDSDMRVAGYRRFLPLLAGDECGLSPKKSLAFVTALELSQGEVSLTGVSSQIDEIRPDAYQSAHFLAQEHIVELGADEVPCSIVDETVKLTRVAVDHIGLYGVLNRKVTVQKAMNQFQPAGSALYGVQSAGFNTYFSSTIFANPGYVNQVQFDPMQLHDGQPSHMIYTATKQSFDNEGEMGVPGKPMLLIAGYDPADPEFTVFRTRIVGDRSGRYSAELVATFAQNGVLRLPGFDPGNPRIPAPAYPADLTGRFDTAHVVLAGQFEVGALSRTAVARFNEHTGVVDNNFGEQGWYVSKNPCPNEQDRALHARYFWSESYYLFGEWTFGGCVEQGGSVVPKINPVLEPKPPYFIPKTQG